MLWKVEGVQPVGVQRLPNGNTFIPSYNGLLLEVDRTGKDVLRVAIDAGIGGARRLPDGRFVAFDRRFIIHLDKTGREVKRVPVAIGGAYSNEVLDNGHVLAVTPRLGGVVEFDMDGKEVGRFNQPGAAHASRLANGHTLVLMQGIKLLELDKDWKLMKETTLSAPGFRVKRR